jgi:membrane-associated phospholipid phosphatase
MVNESRQSARGANRIAVSLLLFLFHLALFAWQGVAYAAGEDQPVKTIEEESLTAGVKAVVEDAKALVVAPMNMDRYDAMKLGGALAVVGGMFAADPSIRNLANRNQSATGKNVADGLSAFGSAGTLAGLNVGVIAIGLARESYGGDSQWKEAGLVGLEAEAFAVAATALLKEVTGRARPEANRGATSFRPFTGLSSSFASSSAAASFAVATVFAERFESPTVAWMAYGLATAVAASRVYTNKHFASDVVAGSLIGWGLGHFINRRHSGDPTDWQIRPMAMEHGMGAGLMVGRKF